MKLDAPHIALWTAVILVSAACVAAAFALHARTLDDGRIAAAVAAAVALPLGTLLSYPLRKISGISHPVANVAIALAATFALIIGAYYTLNYTLSDPSTAHTIEARVSSKYTQKRYHTRRVGRNRYIRDREYTAYRIAYRLPDGTVRHTDVKIEQYLRLRTGSRVDLRAERGLFGPTVIKDFKLIYPAKKSPKHIRKPKKTS